MQMEIFLSNSVEETEMLGGRLAERLGVGDLVAMEGPLGAGKTVLIRGIAAGLGLADERMVSSPTYVLVQEYPGRVTVFHVDLYRVPAGAEEIDDLALDEMLAEGVVLVEWADRAAGALPRPHWRVVIRPTGRDSREITVERAE
ncbi:MAG: tRNA (adenosine(37)-N6)-threonylcarbamoyltransferase complex ATPase subunit type 1 TsaE [Planctomycetota bacterium]|jgi:tRNA threonylcarbamoyl adenosine modification protein YjeE